VLGLQIFRSRNFEKFRLLYKNKYHHYTLQGMTDGLELGRASYRNHIMTQFEQVPSRHLLRRLVPPTPLVAPGEIPDAPTVSPTR